MLAALSKILAFLSFAPSKSTEWYVRRLSQVFSTFPIRFCYQLLGLRISVRIIATRYVFVKAIRDFERHYGCYIDASD